MHGCPTYNHCILLSMSDRYSKEQRCSQHLFWARFPILRKVQNNPNKTELICYNKLVRFGCATRPCAARTRHFRLLTIQNVSNMFIKLCPVYTYMHRNGCRLYSDCFFLSYLKREMRRFCFVSAGATWWAHYSAAPGEKLRHQGGPGQVQDTLLKDKLE